ncbi:nucleotidyltransferase domain-containing protein [Paenibacillus campinasensis]
MLMNVQVVIDQICQELEGINGIVGVVLGGSRARGTHHSHSDIDIGIYYEDAASLDIAAINKAATKLDDDHRENLVTALGDWGSWINGGGWIVVQGFHVDLIYRDIRRVSQVIDDCLVGKISSHYHTGHPHAYLNVVYMGEISICRPLFDPTNQIAKLKAKTVPYPKSLQNALTRFFMFEASFSYMFAKDNADKDDISYVAGHVFRTISCLNQVLFAVNKQYCINEKKAVRMIDGFGVKPSKYKERVDRVFSFLSTKKDSTSQALDILHELISETESLISRVSPGLNK